MVKRNKCIFYADNVCRFGDQTRDCLNCCKIEYKSLYNLNFKNQSEAEDQIAKLEETNKILYQEKCDFIKENDELKKTINKYKNALDEIEKELDTLIVGCFCGDYKCYKCNTGSECSTRCRENIRKLIKEVRKNDR